MSLKIQIQKLRTRFSAFAEAMEYGAASNLLGRIELLEEHVFADVERNSRLCLLEPAPSAAQNEDDAT